MICLELSFFFLISFQGFLDSLFMNLNERAHSTLLYSLELILLEKNDHGLN